MVFGEGPSALLLRFCRHHIAQHSANLLTAGTRSRSSIEIETRGDHGGPSLMRSVSCGLVQAITPEAHRAEVATPGTVVLSTPASGCPLLSMRSLDAGSWTRRLRPDRGGESPTASTDCALA